MATLVFDIRAPRTAGAWLCGALLGLSGAIAQGVFRNPLADPYLLGSASGAALGVALFMVVMGLPLGTALGNTWIGLGLKFGATGSAFMGAALAVFATLTLAGGLQRGLKLVLAGVVVGVMLGAVTSLLTLVVPDILRSMQAFLLGTTAYLGWPAVVILAAVLVPCVAAALLHSRSLDALTLGHATAQSLGVPLSTSRATLIIVLALATGSAVAQSGLVAFVGLAAPHIVRSALRTSRWSVRLVGSTVTGGALLLWADLIARWLLAPQEIPVGVVTAVLGGVYLLWLMHRSDTRQENA
jgi:iron complex transport system permease protein